MQQLVRRGAVDVLVDARAARMSESEAPPGPEVDLHRSVSIQATPLRGRCGDRLRRRLHQSDLRRGQCRRRPLARQQRRGDGIHGADKWQVRDELPEIVNRRLVHDQGRLCRPGVWGRSRSIVIDRRTPAPAARRRTAGPGRAVRDREPRSRPRSCARTPAVQASAARAPRAPRAPRPPAPRCPGASQGPGARPRARSHVAQVSRSAGSPHAEAAPRAPDRAAPLGLRQILAQMSLVRPASKRSVRHQQAGAHRQTSKVPRR